VQRTSVSCVLVFSDFDENAGEVVGTYAETLGAMPHDVQFVVVNNGLGDKMTDQLTAALETRKLSAQVLCLHRAADDATALTQGFGAGNGDVVVVLPPYLQIDPAEIGPMVDRVASGELDCVASWREPRCDPTGDAWKSRLFNALTRWATGSSLHDLNSNLRVMRRDVVEDVQVYGDMYRFVPILAARKGYRVGEQKVRHIEERVKKGDYRLGVYVRRLLDLMSLFFLTKFTSKPLRFFGLVGSSVLTVGALITATVILQWFGGKALSDRPMLVFGVVMIVLGLQLFSIGLLGELIIFTHARDLKEYNVERVYEFVENPDEPSEPATS